eukprot:jgi/Botrbrau1/23491/Bobra.106_1s0042.1
MYKRKRGNGCYLGTGTRVTYVTGLQLPNICALRENDWKNWLRRTPQRRPEMPSTCDCTGGNTHSATRTHETLSAPQR